MSPFRVRIVHLDPCRFVDFKPSNHDWVALSTVLEESVKDLLYRVSSGPSIRALGH